MWVWEEDKTAIEDAETSLKDAEEALEDFRTQEQIDAIQEEIDKNNELIENWNDYIEKLGEASSEYERQINRQNAALAFGQDIQETIWDDMTANLGKNIEESVGFLDQIINKYEELQSKQAELEGMTIEDFENEVGFDTSVGNQSEEYISYDKNTDYMAIIEQLQAELQNIYNKTGEWDEDIQREIERLIKVRQAKIVGEHLDENGQPLYNNERDTELSLADRAAIAEAQQAYEKAQAIGDKAAMAAAHAAAEAIRAKYNYSGGADGSQVTSFASGGVVDYTGLANVHGSQNSAEVTFNAKDAKSLWNYIHNLSNIDSNSIINKLSSAFKNIVPNNDNNGQIINIGNIELPSVKDSNSFVRELRTISLNR